MQYTIKPPTEPIDASINLPSSKSISNRSLIINALSKSKITPNNLSDCDDTNVIIKALKDMPKAIDVGGAGTAMRFMTAFLSVTAGEHIITGSERMKHRPIGVLVSALRSLGASITYEGEEGFPPLCIQGQRLKGGHLDIAGNVSSQYISALLMVGPIFEEGLELRLIGNIVSRPYIDLTLHIMHEYGVRVEWTDVDTITVPAQDYQADNYYIENDWTASNYWYEILALHKGTEAKLTLPGLRDGSRQGDSSVRYIFSLLGIKTAFVNNGDGDQSAVKLSKHACMLKRLEYDFINQPDLAQTFIALCPLLNMPFHFTGLASLKIKETDRIMAMKTEMRKLGYVLHDKNDAELYWDGERCEAENDPVIETYEDHRMAMAFAPLALKLGKITINDPLVVTKSYPHFWEDLKSVGFRIENRD